MLVTVHTCVWKGECRKDERPSFGSALISADAHGTMLCSVGVSVKTTERIHMDETGTCVVQSVRRLPV